MKKVKFYSNSGCWDDGGRLAFLSCIAQQHHHELEIYAQGICADHAYVYPDAKDLVQLLYIRIYERFPVVHKGYSTGKIRYLRRIMWTLYYGAIRRHKSKERTEAIRQSALCTDFDGAEEIINKMHTSYILDVFEREGNAVHYCVYQMYLNGYSYKEISETLDMSMGTIGSIISRTKKEIRNIINKG